MIEKGRFALAVHGGAGTLRRTEMSAEKDTSFSTGESVNHGARLQRTTLCSMYERGSPLDSRPPLVDTRITFRS